MCRLNPVVTLALTFLAIGFTVSTELRFEHTQLGFSVFASSKIPTTFCRESFFNSDSPDYFKMNWTSPQIQFS